MKTFAISTAFFAALGLAGPVDMKTRQSCPEGHTAVSTGGPFPGPSYICVPIDLKAREVVERSEDVETRQAGSCPEGYYPVSTAGPFPGPSYICVPIS